MSEVSELGPTGAMPDETMRAELLEETAIKAGMRSLLNHGAGSVVWSEGVLGVAQAQLQAFYDLAFAAGRASAAPGGEPVAWLMRFDKGRPVVCTIQPADKIGTNGIVAIDPLYAAPLSDAGQRVALTDEQIGAEFARLQGEEEESMVFDLHDFRSGAQWAERAHGIRAVISESEGSSNG